MSSALKICRKDIFPAIVAIFNWITKKPNGDGGSAMFLFVDLKIISDYDKASVSRAKVTKSWNLNYYIYINMYLIGRILNLNALIILVFSLQVNDFQKLHFVHYFIKNLTNFSTQQYSPCRISIQILW